MTLPPPHLLVVDDEPDLRTLYELTLLKVGYQVDAADSLTSARALLAERQYQLVITDMRLPDGMGLELVRQIATQQRPEKTIVITAYGSAENAVEALKAGAFDYLTKPVELPQLRQAWPPPCKARPHPPNPSLPYTTPLVQKPPLRSPASWAIRRPWWRFGSGLKRWHAVWHPSWCLENPGQARNW